MFDVIDASLIATLLAPSSDGGTAGRLRRSIVSSILMRALWYAILVEADSSTGTVAIILSVWRTLSKHSTVSVHIRWKSGVPRSSAAVSGIFSKHRTMSYARNPTAPPKKRGRLGNSGARN